MTEISMQRDGNLDSRHSLMCERRSHSCSLIKNIDGGGFKTKYHTLHCFLFYNQYNEAIKCPYLTLGIFPFNR
jgi:hypothetical protein